MKLYYYYDREADVLYFSKGKPSAKDQAQETRDDVILRLDPRTQEVRGFSVLNFMKRLSSKATPLPLPFNIEFSPS